MKLEHQLDQLIELHQSGAKLPPAGNEEIDSRLAVVSFLTQLKQITVPSEYAARLEFDIRRQVRTLKQKKTFNAASLPSARIPAHNFTLRRSWITVLSMAAVLLFASISMVTASAKSLPGDPLYSLKQLGNQLSLTFVNDPQQRDQVNVSQLRSALADLNTVVSDGRNDDAIIQALNTVNAKTNDSRNALADIPSGTDRDQAKQSLDQALTEEEHMLRQLLPHVDWIIRVLVTQQLGLLGDAVPTITRGMVKTQSTGTILITVSGTNFVPNSLLFINGQQKGKIIQLTMTSLVAVINQAEWPHGARRIEILNPDGTAAQFILNENSDDQNSPGDNQQNKQGTPTPNASQEGKTTPTPAPSSTPADK